MTFFDVVFTFGLGLIVLLFLNHFTLEVEDSVKKSIARYEEVRHG